MKFFTALVAALGLLAFAGAASAGPGCSSQEQTTELPPPTAGT